MEYMYTMFTPLPSTAENKYFEGVWSRIFGSFMASGREKAGLSVEQAADLTGIEAQMWSAMEAGDWLPETRQQFHLIAAALDIEWTLMVSVVQMCSQAWGIQ
jgi:transcriptional regulator with XRE-family HTH domain